MRWGAPLVQQEGGLPTAGHIFKPCEPVSAACVMHLMSCHKKFPTHYNNTRYKNKVKTQHFILFIYTMQDLKLGWLLPVWLQTPRYSGWLKSSLVHARVWNLFINFNLYFRILAWHGFTAPSTKVTFTQFFNFFLTIFNICPWFRSKNSIVEIDMIYERTLVSPCRVINL